MYVCVCMCLCAHAHQTFYMYITYPSRVEGVNLAILQTWKNNSLLTFILCVCVDRTNILRKDNIRVIKFFSIATKRRVNNLMCKKGIASILKIQWWCVWSSKWENGRNQFNQETLRHREIERKPYLIHPKKIGVCVCFEKLWDFVGAYTTYKKTVQTYMHSMYEKKSKSQSLTASLIKFSDREFNLIYSNTFQIKSNPNKTMPNILFSLSVILSKEKNAVFFSLSRKPTIVYVQCSS